MAMREIALIGAGQMGANHARTIARSEIFKLKYVVDEDLNRARNLAASFDVLAIGSIDGLSGVDAAVVATSTMSHFSIANDLLSLSIPTLVEKPLTPDLPTTKELLENARSQGVPIQCGFVERFNPAFATARKLLDEPVLHAQAIRHSPPANRIASGVAEDLLIHDLDLALTLKLGSVIEVSGFQVTSPKTHLAEIADCSVLFGASSVISLSASRMSQRKIRDWRICTESQLIEVDLLRQTVAIFENINQEVGVGGGASYRARTTVDYPFIERVGEPLAMQLEHFGRLMDGAEDAELERQGILESHALLSEYLNVSLA